MAGLLLPAVGDRVLVRRVVVGVRVILPRDASVVDVPFVLVVPVTSSRRSVMMDNALRREHGNA